jgi:hypothetical protein
MELEQFINVQNNLHEHLSIQSLTNDHSCSLNRDHGPLQLGVKT